MRVFPDSFVSSVLNRRWITRFATVAFSATVVGGGTLYLLSDSSRWPQSAVQAAAGLNASDQELTSRDIPADVVAILKSRCYECHSADIDEGNLSFDVWQELGVNERDRKLEHIVRAIRLGEMPPEGSDPLEESELKRVLDWADQTLEAVAKRDANNPGDVVLRRLSNLEYNYTIRDLTQIASLNPTKEFPGDNAAGEGFTNAGAAMVMSPSLFTKYLDAAKEIANHAVLTPTGAEFSESTSQNDWATERLERIKTLYSKYSDNRGAEAVNLQGVAFNTNQGGRLPFDRYLQSLLRHWPKVLSGELDYESVAHGEGLSPKYLKTLADVLQTNTAPENAKSQSPLINELARQWQAAVEKQSTDELESWISQWQKSLWKFSSVGHIGKLNGPKAWQEPLDPLVTSLALKTAIQADTEQLHIAIHNAGDSDQGDNVVLWNPRFIRSGEPDVSLADALSLDNRWKEFSERVAGTTASTLAVVALVNQPLNLEDIQALATKHNISKTGLRYWLDQLGLTKDDAALPSERQATLLTQSVSKMGDHEGIQGWIGGDALSIIANAKDEVQRIPGWIAPKSVAVHPAPDRSVGLGLTVATEGAASISGLVEHVHTECGNGTAWSLEVIRSGQRIVLATGFSAGKSAVNIGPFPIVPLIAGDEVCLQISPRDGNHSCDMTRIDLTVEQDGKRWNAAESLSGRISEANPLPAGNDANWKFYSQPTSAWGASTLPADSLLSRWWLAPSAEDKQAVAIQLENLLKNTEQHATASAPDQQLIRNLVSVKRYLQLAGSESKPESIALEASSGSIPYDQERIALGNAKWVSIPIPNALRNGWEFVADAKLDADSGRSGSVQLSVVTNQFDRSTKARMEADPILNAPVLVHEQSDSTDRIRASVDELRKLFPIALCYHQIVPVDEVVTLTLYHREDDQLKQLMLSDAERASLDQLWSELYFVSHDALQSVDAFEQLWQYATQDADPSAFEPLRQPILDRAAAFKLELLEAEPVHREWLQRFATSAYRRSLDAAEREGLEQLYSKLREQGLSHDASIRGCIARILVAPEFLYRMEKPAEGDSSAPVSPQELATRLSYFLWSSTPDEELLSLANDGTLVQDDVLKNQMRRMLQDPRAQRFARAFMGQWLQVSNIAELDEKSETVFPEFVALRESIQQESDRFFEHLVVENRPPMELLTADYTFANSDIRALYGMTDGEQEDSDKAADSLASQLFTKVDGISKWNRGGFMRQASVLAKNAGASRTSAILRGTWVSEVLLGEPLPKPPKNVPPLPDSVPENLSERELIELHVSAPECSGCHKRIDPFGFPFEEFDAIGRYRVKDNEDRPINSATELPDGTKITGAQDLISYLSNEKKSQYLTQFHRKLLGYAIGREVALSDRPLIQSLVGRCESDRDYGIWDAVEAVVLSRQFREIRGEEKE